MMVPRFSGLLVTSFGVALLGSVPLTAAEPPVPLTPRAARVAERIYARQAIAEARAARAEARAAEIAKVVPVPPPPRPATVRRMARAGVPMGTPSQAVIAAHEAPVVSEPVAPNVDPPAVVRKATPGTQSPTGTASRDSKVVPTPGAWTLDPDPASSPVVEHDGTRSVLATSGETPPPPAAPATDVDRPGPAVTQPPIELLPTPPAE
jgi:hypothetical protein